MKLAGDYHQNLKMVATAKRSIPTILIEQAAWTFPPQNWIKVNTDGSYSGVLGIATCGGIARSHDSQFLAAWSVHLGPVIVTVSELWGVLWALL